MALLRSLLFLTFGFLIAAFGVQRNAVTAEDIKKSSNISEDILTLIFSAPDSGAEGTATNKKTSELIDEIFRVSRNSSVNGNGNFNASSKGEAEDLIKAVFGIVNEKVNVNRRKVPGNLNGTSTDIVNVKSVDNLSDVRKEVNVNISNKVKGKVNDSADDEVNGNAPKKVSDDKNGKHSKFSQESTPGVIEVQPYFIIDAPIRENDDDHECKNGQRWFLGHCRDILD